MKKIFFLFCVLICTMVCYNVSFSQNDLDKQLFEAVKSNNFDDVKILVEKGANVDALDKDSGTVLMWATYKGDLDLVKFFVEIGADCKKKGVIRTANGWYGNLLSIAAGELKFDLLKYYIEECKINIDDREYNPDTKKEDGWTALHYAVYRGFVNLVVYLLEKGANINVKDYEGNTPLITSVNASESEILKILYLYGADSKIKNNDGKTASDLAKEKNKTSIISFLKNPSVNIFYIINQHLDNILIKRILENKTLILEKDEFGRSLLHYSILYGNIDLTSQLLDNGADINAKDNDNNTPFHYALNNLKIDIAKNLINRNADLNIKNNNNETALILSIKKGLNDITTLLDEKEY
ncbi:MAG: ankyrin repeat domain-containing protein, partial [Ignavibacteriae bacterium]|nr:ankyrin repeat domain-containing protein [Ignavibacteriota bacterium]